jgi:HSP20 family protein
MADQELQATPKKEVAPSEPEFTREGTHYSPAVDIYSNEKELVLLADMAGVSSDRVEIDLRENTLTIIGRTSEEGEKAQYVLAEYCPGNYYRSFRITEIVDQTRITASMSDGVLKLVLPKVDKAVPRKIPISGE